MKARGMLLVAMTLCLLVCHAWVLAQTLGTALGLTPALLSEHLTTVLNEGCSNHMGRINSADGRSGAIKRLLEHLETAGQIHSFGDQSRLMK